VGGEAAEVNEWQVGYHQPVSSPRSFALLLVCLLALASCQATTGQAPAAPGANRPSAPQRPPNSTDVSSEAILASAFNPAAVRLTLEPITTAAREPTGVFSAYDGSGRLFILERGGRILVLRDGQLLSQPFLDISPLVLSGFSEQGLLGIAFHPRYRENGYFYVNYTARNGDDTVARYSVSSNADVADPGTGAVMLAIPDPAPNHNGGNLVFGPDGYLYIGFGDGGGGGDQFGNGQNMEALLGKMLRVDVDAAFPYGIPPDNPFVGSPRARPEIWAYGLRNPWRYAFDPATGNLFIADVGQNRYEEIHLQPAGVGGQNYGWPIMEGLHCFPETRACNRSGLELPIAEYDHALGCSITGGYVYRGSAYPDAQGGYIYGDFCSGRIWVLYLADGGAWRQMQLMQMQLGISSFGEDETGELYVASLEPSGIFRLHFG
jgi:glucose/arabinose dehydrogenase